MHMASQAESAETFPKSFRVVSIHNPRIYSEHLATTFFTFPDQLLYFLNPLGCQQLAAINKIQQKNAYSEALLSLYS